MQLELRGLAHHYAMVDGTFPVLDRVDLEVRSGEFVCVLGPSGCGKSTLLNLLAGLLPAGGGQILLDGRAVAHVRSQAAYMQQKDLLLPWRRALENALLGAQLQKADRHRAAAEARELFARFGLDGHERHYPAVLSGGQRQRVALVRTLLTHRPLLLLDEPFGALDAITRVRLQRWLLAAWADFHKTVLMVTHDLDEALALADRIYVLGARPARVLRAFPVPLPRPRARMGLEFARARGALWEALGEVDA